MDGAKIQTLGLRLGVFFFAVLVLLLTSACAQRSLLPEQGYLVSTERMQEQIAKRFPASKNFSGLVDVKASAPKLEMDAANKRVRAAITMDVDSRLFKTRKQYQGQMHLSSGLRFDPKQMAIVLQNPEVEHFDLGPEAEARMGIYKPIAVGMLSKWLEAELEAYPLYPLSDANKWVLGSKPDMRIEVEPQGLLFLPK